MIVRLTLTDFMAHERTVFDFASGLNVLTGPNNTGKSAVVEALRCLSENPVPRHVIRHGAAEARVEAEIEDGVTVTWVRRPKYALYEVRRPGVEEPEVFAKFGRAVPEEVRRLLRLGPVALDGEANVDVHIGNQREPVFLLNEPGTVVAGFFAASTEAAHLVAMQARLTERSRKTKTEKKRLEKTLAATAGSLCKLATLPELELRLEAAAGQEAEAVAQEAAAARLEQHLAARQAAAGRIGTLAQTAQTLGRLTTPPALVPTAPLAALAARQTELSRSVARTAGRENALARLIPPPTLTDTAALAARLTALVRAADAVFRSRRRAGALAPLDEPPAVADAKSLAALAARLVAQRTALAQRQRRRDRLAALAEPPAIADVERLSAAVRALTQGRKAVAALSRRQAVQAILVEPPQTAEVGSLAGLARELSAARAAVAATAAQLAAKDRALAAFADRVEQRLAALGACPLCGGDLSADSFLHGGHSHGRPGEEQTS